MTMAHGQYSAAVLLYCHCHPNDKNEDKYDDDGTWSV